MNWNALIGIGFLWAVVVYAIIDNSQMAQVAAILFVGQAIHVHTEKGR